MKDIKNLIKKSSINKLNVDKKVVSILLVFLILVSTLLISIVVSTNSLSALRGFASFQTNWTSARKDVTFQLVNYLRTQDHTFKENMDSSIFLIQEMEHIRIELMKDNTDRELVVELLEKTHSVPDDIGRMITTFENFHEFSEFRETIALWIESDSIIIDMEILGNTAERIINEGKLTPEVQESLISEVIALDDKLTQMQFRLSRSLAIGTDLLNMVIVIVIISLVIISIVIGAIFS